MSPSIARDNKDHCQNRYRGPFHFVKDVVMMSQKITELLKKQAWTTTKVGDSQCRVFASHCGHLVSALGVESHGHMHIPVWINTCHTYLNTIVNGSYLSIEKC